ncbi:MULTISPECIES: ABC transporter ATP-binding protein [Nocardiopsis]|uniref:Oligopeptide/dipeptide ABC transporter, ATPase subunit n=1 Tax=Nocardiopsis dassonvillei (strain ATCC 23218 / DSM 43111 / CIP 107115 / JCM 7437 / KCTC 9190 / NBRC 14626 / NCTC 10488 / NRRL B-5397 / IMRU 509) TaxID=446468 RepID=D7B532_NOCDD|nr:MULTISPECIES: ABC transporter ATP-binding protein [Nocardiopsis]ADH69053.1 oligopeptide/dipeptide ABC transporter, ATPase subunit [Nocardiopsis dassonvillei subsp. dassonvillei DSM 43111]APC37094.1 dipeptide/oligopeptide/nickel ABC transporter ATP-binding protein [Nocardiopsis dassonvillei]ASU60047.1 ABC transporter ATP-binding protein [Nocardiopsis dassonvillei]NKY78403.1 ABC transporter ATP-binding protein [Nocardiopsis dassonvillei]VEI89563.1 Glutathione import ATP-binding protein GsiA [
MTLRVKDLKVYYQTLRGDVHALDGVTFDLADGEIMGLAGESGCGKTTLGKSLIRLDSRMRHVGGTIELDGKDVPIADDRAMVPLRYHEISLIPQYAMSALNPTRKIGRMINELLRARGVRPADVTEELHRRLELVGLDTDVLNRFPIELSGGMKQRVVMVISTLLNPSLLIADEVTSALDVSTQRSVAESMVEFRDRGYIKSMVFVTHDISLVYQMADTIMVMYAGHIVEKAAAGTIINEPKHPYTQMLIGALPEVGSTSTVQGGRLAGIPGTPPGLLNPPTGCRFKDRCPMAFSKCSEKPPLVEIEPGHWAACWKTG